MNDIYTRFEKYKEVFKDLLRNANESDIAAIRSLIDDPIDGRFVIAALSTAVNREKERRQITTNKSGKSVRITLK